MGERSFLCTVEGFVYLNFCESEVILKAILKNLIAKRN